MALKIAVPSLFRDSLQAAGYPPGVEAGEYRDIEGALAIAGDAEVVWSSLWRPEDVRALVDGAPRLRWLFSNGAGVEQLPLQTLAERGITLTNGAGLHAIPIAEYVVMGILAAAKGMPQLDAAQRARTWLDRPPSYRELFGSRALVVGYGGIGRAVAERLRPFGVHVTGVRRRGTDEADVITGEGWRGRLGEFDWVILCAPLTGESRHLLGPAELAALKPGAWIVNIARGGLIDQTALIAALAEGRIGGAYLDVTDPEPLPAQSPLWELPNAIITPHTSWASERFRDRAAALFLDNLDRFRSDRPLRNVVDLAAGY